MLVLITGSRDWNDVDRIQTRMALLPKDCTILEGGARGADQIAHDVARLLKLKCITVPADWKAHGKAAGPMRNVQMLDMKPDLVIGFPKTGSRGTVHCLFEARRRGIKTEVYQEVF